MAERDQFMAMGLGIVDLGPPALLGAPQAYHPLPGGSPWQAKSQPRVFIISHCSWTPRHISPSQVGHYGKHNAEPVSS